MFLKSLFIYRTAKGEAICYHNDRLEGKAEKTPPTSKYAPERPPRSCKAAASLARSLSAALR